MEFSEEKKEEKKNCKYVTMTINGMYYFSTDEFMFLIIFFCITSLSVSNGKKKKKKSGNHTISAPHLPTASFLNVALIT